MFNPYAIILGLFIIAGFIAALWGWFIIAKARKTRRWPVVEGIIEQSAPTSEANDLLPHILFSYTVGARLSARIGISRWYQSIAGIRHQLCSEISRWRQSARILQPRSAGSSHA